MSVMGTFTVTSTVGLGAGSCGFRRTHHGLGIVTGRSGLRVYVSVDAVPQINSGCRSVHTLGKKPCSRLMLWRGVSSLGSMGLAKGIQFLKCEILGPAHVARGSYNSCGVVSIAHAAHQRTACVVVRR